MRWGLFEFSNRYISADKITYEMYRRTYNKYTFSSLEHLVIIIKRKV